MHEFATYLKRQAMLGGESHAPPEVSIGIQEARSEIARIKAVLRRWSVDVEDLPDDDPRSHTYFMEHSHPRISQMNHARSVHSNIDQENNSLLSRHQICPMIAIMGAKGGVGKTTLAARLAELVAETGANVVLIDIDIESAGSTVLHRKRSQSGLGRSITTVYDHLQYVQDPDRSGAEVRIDLSHQPLEDVTPRYLQQRGLGSIYLSPISTS